MERIAALVEGHTETHFVKAAYPRAIVQRCLPNGKDVHIDLIIETIHDRMEILGGDIKKVIIIFDREGRIETAEQIHSYVREKLNKLCNNRKFYIGVSDKQIENWIVADNEYLRKIYNKIEYQYPGDGTSGKEILKKLHGTDQAPGDKAKMLKLTTPSKSKQNSLSLANFIDQIDFPWDWAEA
jgi:hypothetical protein